VRQVNMTISLAFLAPDLVRAAVRGTEFLGAEKAKICLRNRKRHRRPKERNDNGEDPHRSDLSGVAIGNVEKASFDRSSNERSSTK
jgi:hypothetical protein